MKLIALITLVFIPNLYLTAQIFSKKKADNDTRQWRYEVEAIAEGKDGTYVVRVWSYSKKPEIAIEQSKKNALHGAIFQGIVGVGKVSSQPPIAPDPGVEQQYSSF